MRFPNRRGRRMRYCKPILIIIVLAFLLGFSAYLLLGPSGNKTNEISNTVQSTNSTNSPANTSGDSSWVAFSATILFLLSISIFSNILLFKWRRQATNEQTSIVPTELLMTLEQLMGRFVQMNKQLNINLDQSEKYKKITHQLFSDLMETFTVLQSKLDDREKEIKRLKNGYDFQIFRRFLNRFIRIDYALSEEIHDAISKNGNNLNTLQDIQSLLRDALLECGVSAFSPKIGENVREAFGISDNYQTVTAQTEEGEFTIAEVIEPGFKLQALQGEEPGDPAEP